MGTKSFYFFYLILVCSQLGIDFTQERIRNYWGWFDLWLCFGSSCLVLCV